jgi:hypothetical protein
MWSQLNCDDIEDAGVFCIDGKYITVMRQGAGVFCIDDKYITVMTQSMLVSSVMMAGT